MGEIRAGTSFPKKHPMFTKVTRIVKSNFIDMNANFIINCLLSIFYGEITFESVSQGDLYPQL